MTPAGWWTVQERDYLKVELAEAQQKKKRDSDWFEKWVRSELEHLQRMLHDFPDQTNEALDNSVKAIAQLVRKEFIE